MPTSPTPASDRHLWQIRWVRDLVILALLALILYIGYVARAVTVPALIGLALAYAFNPLVGWLRARYRVPRWLTTVLIMLLLLLIISGLITALAPRLYSEASDLFSRLRTVLSDPAASLQKVSDYLHGRFPNLAAWLESLAPTPATQPSPLEPGGVEEQPAAGFDWQSITPLLMRSLNIGINVVGSAISLVGYLALAAVLIAFSFFMFSWRFGGLQAWVTEFIPHHSRARTLEILKKMDNSVSAFLRGRIIQSLILATVLSTGWGLIGVKYWLLLGVASGFLNLIPYAAIIGWPSAIVLAGFGAGHFDFWWVIFWPSIVYFIGQGLDGWVVEPLVQGKATNLDPLTILMAVLVGGALLGLFGMIIAIPTAACIKILGKEVVLPKLRTWAKAQA